MEIICITHHETHILCVKLLFTFMQINMIFKLTKKNINSKLIKDFLKLHYNLKTMSTLDFSTNFWAILNISQA
jgi:hypothetical protein